jgi:tetratricopeptide (TPR) repeat protein
MKKLISFLLVAVMMFSLAACGKSVSNGNNANSDANKTAEVGAKYASFADYDAAFVLAVGKTGSWTPFSTDSGFDWKNADGSIANANGSGHVLTFKALAEGETVLTATLNGETKRALLRVLPAPAVDSPDGWIEWYIDCIIDDLEGMDEENQVEYLLTIGDYMALSQATGDCGGEFLSMAEAATLIYPCEYLLNNYGTLLMSEGDFAEAVIWLEKANEAGTNNPMVLTNIAECYYQLGDTNAAMNFATQALTAEPGYGLAYLIMTCVHPKNGNDILAMETLFKSMRTV